MHLERPNPARLVVATAYALATAGLLVFAFDTVLYNRWTTVAVGIVSLVGLALILLTGKGIIYLVVGGVWVYAAVMAMIRGLNNYERAGLGLIFVGLAVGALGAFVAYEREIL